jgi:hypothetical protein
MLPQHCKSGPARRTGDVLGAAPTRPPPDLGEKNFGRFGQNVDFERVAAFGLDRGGDPVSDHSSWRGSSPAQARTTPSRTADPQETVSPGRK